MYTAHVRINGYTDVSIKTNQKFREGVVKCRKPSGVCRLLNSLYPEEKWYLIKTDANYDDFKSGQQRVRIFKRKIKNWGGRPYQIMMSSVHLTYSEFVMINEIIVKVSDLDAHINDKNLQALRFKYEVYNIENIMPQYFTVDYIETHPKIKRAIERTGKVHDVFYN